jgi:hypothetical protein
MQIELSKPPTMEPELLWFPPSEDVDLEIAEKRYPALGEVHLSASVKFLPSAMGEILRFIKSEPFA